MPAPALEKANLRLERSRVRQSKQRIGFVELPDEALELFGHYAKRPNWEVAVVVSRDAESYAARMADILQVPVIERANRPALMECNRIVVGNTTGLIALINDLVEGTDIEVIPIDQAFRESGSTPSKPAPKPREQAEASPTPGSTDSGYISDSSFDAGTLLGADFREKLGAISIDADADQMLHKILEIAVRVIQADSGSIMLVDEYGTHLRVAVADGLPKWVIAHTRQQVGTGIAGQVFATGKPRLLHGHLPSSQSGSAEVRPGLRQAACVPIPGKDGPIGVLNVSVESEGRKLDEQSITLLNLFAREASSAVIKALNLSRLSGTTQREAVMRQIERLMSLQEPLANRLRSVGEVLGQTLGADYTHCFVVDPAEPRLKLQGSAKGVSVVHAQPQSLDRGFFAWILATDNVNVLEAEDPDSSERMAMIYLPILSGMPQGLLVLEKVPMGDTPAAKMVDLLTEAKEKIEAQISLEETTGDLGYTEGETRLRSGLGLTGRTNSSQPSKEKPAPL